MLTILILLIVGHFLGDYVFQNNEIALGKNDTIEQNRHGVPWFYWMLSHGMAHGAIVYLITQNIHLLIFETIAHCLIDWCKCHKILNIHTDQLLHLACKCLWALSLYWIL